MTRLLAALALAAFVSAPAEAAWVRPNKKPVSSWQGFQDSANGAVTTILPWNWFGGGTPKKRNGAYSEYRDR